MTSQNQSCAFFYVCPWNTRVRTCLAAPLILDTPCKFYLVLDLGPQYMDVLCSASRQYFGTRAERARNFCKMWSWQFVLYIHKNGHYLLVVRSLHGFVPRSRTGVNEVIQVTVKPDPGSSLVTAHQESPSSDLHPVHLSAGLTGHQMTPYFHRAQPLGFDEAAKIYE